MSTSQTTPVSPTPPAPGAAPPSRRGLLIGGVVAALIVVALVMAVIVSGGDDGGPGEAQDPAVSTTIAVGGVPAAEQQPVAVSGTALPALEDETADAALGQPAPALNGYSFDGSPLEVAPGGSAKMVVFLAHWCPHCNREVPRLLEWQESGRVPEGLEVIGVATATDDTSPNYPPSAWLADFGWTWPTLADSAERTAAQAYGVSGFPFFVIVGEDGTIKARFSGEREVDEIDAVVREALGTA
jgi:cytochrome c biogenesis protein CcmG, thiol:disulfide interchange protein DsbE